MACSPDRVQQLFNAQLAKPGLITHQELADLRTSLSASSHASTAQLALPTSEEDHSEVHCFSTEEMEKQLDLVGLSVTDLSDSGRQHLRGIAGVAHELGLATAATPALIAALAQLRLRQWRAEDSQEEAERLCEALHAQTALAEGRAAALDAASANLDAAAALKDADLDVRRGRRERMRAKHEGYLRDIAATVAKLSAASYQPNLSHGSLTARSQQLAATHARIRELQQRLEAFRDLPPDFDAARRVFAAKQEQVANANRLFEQGLAEL